MHAALFLGTWLFRRNHRGITYFSVITCPHCKRRSRDQMPGNACVYFYPCSGCGRMLRPLPGKCCVYCSYGDTPCPPKQAERLPAETE